jgi:hypothetical protein
MTVRELVYGILSADAELVSLGLTPATTYANGAADSPKERTWAILRWGAETVATGGQRGRLKTVERDVTLWVYDKQRDYDNINSIIKRWCVLMENLEARRTGDGVNDGWLSQCYWQGDGDDTYDDVYEAWTKPSTYTIVANGD